ncbi:MAG TPA: SusC/RagA family TonB-linked outer membrane protein [Flavitalea sp.]|nr:SusC/RagA family TonB-linked outer membrane protein [Flavitalea sp.]
MLSLVFFESAMAQNNLSSNPIVSGTVLSDSGESLSAVSVKVSLSEGKQVASAISDKNGAFTINNLKEGNLYDFVFSYVGYELTTLKRFKVNEGNGNTILVRLKPQSSMLNDVVVTALNIKRDRRNTGYLLESLKGDRVSENKTVNIKNALSGKIAGLDVGATANGAAGSKRVTIRGIGSISGNNQPLWVVDGIPVNSSAIGNATPSGGGGIDFGDGLTFINPDDIESISVLKGNAAAALYGSRASTGAILVTTKSGSKLGKNKFEVSYNASYTIDQVKDLTDWQYEYGQGIGGKAPVSLQQVLASPANWGAKLDGSDVLQFDNKLRPYVAQRDNVKNFYKDGSTLSNALSLSGRTDNTNFRVSASNLSNKDIIPNSSFNRNSFSFHSETKYDKLTVNAVINYSIEKAKNRQRIGGNYSNVNYTILNLPTNVNVLDMQPGYNPSGAEIGINDQGIPTNPYFVTNKIVEQDQRRRVNGSIELKYDFTKWLFAKGRVLEDYFSYEEKDYTPDGVIWSPKGGGMNEDRRNNSEENYELIIGTNKHKLFSDLKISGFAGGNIYNSLSTSSNVNGTVFILDNIYTINNLSVKYPSTGYSRQKINSLFFSSEIEFRDLFINVTGRKDWFSTLPLNNNSLYYPSVSLSYVLNNRHYPSWLSFAKIRGSFAQVSGGASPYQLNLNYRLDRDNYNGISLQNISNTTVPNSLLKPLLSTEYETGLDLAFLNNRATLNLTYYNRRTKQDIVSTNISITSGYNAAIVNLGQISNKGIETSLKVNMIESKNFSWEMLGLFSFNKNKVESLGPGTTKLQLAQSKTGNAFINIETGSPYGQIEGYKYSLNSKGQVIYDANGFPLSNGVVNVLGNGNYDKIASLGNTISFRDFHFYFLLDSKFGAKIYSEVNSLAVGNGTSKSTLPGRETGITGEGVTTSGEPNTVLVTPANLNSYYGRVATFSENYVYDASFIKLREISIGYRIPKNVVSMLHISNASVNVIARNLLTLYKKTPNFDPESNTTSDNAQGIAATVYPATRNLGISLNVTF